MDPLAYKLSDEEHQEVFERLKNELFAFTTSVEKPTAVILGGQPGAGKGGLIALSAREFPDSNFVVINGDEFRKEHPKSEEIFKKHEQDYAKLTDPDVREWTKKLFDLAIQTKRNLIFEGTMRTDGPIRNTLRNLKQQGYHVVVRVMAVNEKISLLGTHERYEEQKQIFGHGRSVPKEAHDAAYDGMLRTIERIEKEKLFDLLQVYNRDKTLLYENRVLGNEWKHPPKVVEAIQKERNKEWTPEQVEQYIKAWNRVMDKMVLRNADPQEIIAVCRLCHEILANDLVRAQSKIAKLTKVIQLNQLLQKESPNKHQVSLNTNKMQNREDDVVR
ncbi:zeta toxin family protein [Staphylospora marina]|uniref:zeta toxin family protein n=1 Tax=Staphylospora marina TaxID=2490858 RepID=UPI000F5B93D4|nr:zeta toxin family protein [Staphylospora marina]